MTPTRSPSASASSWSCVTKRAVVPTMIWIRRISSRSRRRTLASSAESGSSSSSTFGSDGQRARERHALLLAAGELVRVVVAVRPEPDELQQLVRAAPPARPRRRRADAARTRRCRGPSCSGRGCRPGRRRPCRGDSPAPRDVASVDDDAPESGSSSPASERSAVVLPQPDGPSSATISPGAISSVSPSRAWTARSTGAGRAAARPRRRSRADRLGRRGGVHQAILLDRFVGRPAAVRRDAREPRMRKNANSRAASETATATNALRLPSRLMTTWTVS